MAKIIKGNNDGKNGGKDSYRIPGRGSNIPRHQLVKEVKEGQHPNHSTVKLNGETYVRAKPNCTESDNVNND
jgi:hypothetical protein